MKLRQHILVFLAVLCLPGISQAAVDWSVDKIIETKTTIKDIAISFDGKSIFVLTAGDKLVMFDDNGKSQGEIKVDAGMDKIVLSGFQKAGVPEHVFVSNSATGQVQQLSFSVVAQIDMTGSPFLGNAEAPVALVVFSDFQ